MAKKNLTATERNITQIAELITKQEMTRIVRLANRVFDVSIENECAFELYQNLMSEPELKATLENVCSHISSALFLLAIEKVDVSTMGHCRGCGGVLIADRTNKQFCDSKCRSRYFMRQLRERQKKAHKKGKAN